MTNEQRNESARNNRKAWKWFEAHGYQQHKGLVLHHKDQEMKTRNPKRYRQWKVEDLEVMTLAEHRRLHMRKMTKGKPKTKLHKQHISLGLKKKTTDGKIIVVDNGTEKAVFPSFAAAAKHIGCSRQLLSQCCSAANNKKARGYTVKLVDVIDLVNIIGL